MPKKSKTGDASQLEEYEIVRPHLFHTPRVSGLICQVPTLESDKLSFELHLVVRFADDRREEMPLPKRLEISKKSSIVFDPLPKNSTRGHEKNWSAGARTRFLSGNTPKPTRVFKSMTTAITTFIEFPKKVSSRIIEVLGLWVLLTYCYGAWRVVPYLSIGGAKGSGKTTLLEVLDRLVFSPLRSSNLTAPLLFRTLHNEGGTLLFDEAERLRGRDSNELLSILHSGYRAGSPAHRLEKVGEDYVPVSFDVFGPKAIAGISQLPETLAERCIQIIMIRAPKDSPKTKKRLEEHRGLFNTIRDDLHALALAYGPEFVKASKRNDVGQGLSNRGFELFQPLLALAKFLEQQGVAGIHKRVREFALQHVEEFAGSKVSERDEILLKILAGWLKDGIGYIQPKKLLEAARLEESDLFKQWSPKGVANAVRRYGLVAKRSHGKSTYDRITLRELKEVQRRYGFDLGFDP